MKVLSIVLLALFLIPAAAPVPGYHNHQALTQALRSSVSAHPQLAQMASIGKTLEGRDLWMVEIGRRSGTPLDERPALLIVANLEGNQLVGSEIALGIVDYLLENSAEQEVSDRLDEAVFYVIPRANPDGAERMFGSLQTGGAGNAHPMDDDNDGRTDEDGPEDLNGDGFITMMRVADPMGEYMVDPADARLLKKADPAKGETGMFKVYWEGTDNDGDGFYNEDAKGSVNLNRNFQHAYPYYTVGAGPHMVSEMETRAIMDFVIGHRNIAAAYVLGPHDNLVNAPNNKGELSTAKGVLLPEFADASNTEARETGMVERPRRRGFFRGGGQDQARTGRPSSGRRPETTVNSDDQEYFKKVSDRYREIVGVTELPGIEKPAGAFFEYGYYQFGVPSFATPGWSPGASSASDSTAAAGDAAADEEADDDAVDNGAPDDGGAAQAAGRNRGSSGARGGAGGSRRGGGDDASVDLKLVQWMDAKGIDGFVPWTSSTHATLGQVEIGGFKPYEYLNPPMTLVEELAPKHGAFAVELASLFADVRIAKTEVIDHGGGVFRIKAEVENGGFFPTSTAHGVASRSVKPTMVQLEIEPEALLSGDPKTSFFQAMAGSGKRSSFEWIISGRRGDTVSLRAVSQKGGQDVANIRLQ